MSNKKKKEASPMKVAATKYLTRIYFGARFSENNIRLGFNGGSNIKFDIANYKLKIVGLFLDLKGTKTGKLRKSWEDKILSRLYKLYLIPKDYRRILFVPKGTDIATKIKKEYACYIGKNIEIIEV